ncbi:ion transporter [Butyrivibrio sp. MC2013]|uniref:ion transporter n=1 Tax=Butyrivibrio sp. MC2013 TaxID=1280686 RepID=UPI000409FA96|nr:ion transporter [Butyrivibrio sp. MC2013]
MAAKTKEERIRALFKMVSVGVIDDPINQSYDVISTGALIANLVGAFAGTFKYVADRFGTLLYWVELITVIFFAVDYTIRLITSHCLYPDRTKKGAVAKYVFSFDGIVDLLSFLPYFLPIFFPAGIAAFRMFRMIRIFRLFRINAYYDSLNVITEVISAKSQQLLSSVFIIFTLMLASSLCMYSLEHEAQPDIFENAFSGIWWSVSTLLTVGYGDIYPVTILGKIFSIIITFLGVGMVAIPTGIISAGFVEQYSRFTNISDVGIEENMKFITVRIKAKDEWTGKNIKDISLPHDVAITAIQRGNETIIPRGNVILKADDRLVLGTTRDDVQTNLTLKEITIKKHNPWNGMQISDLDISRKTFIVLIKRQGENIFPNGSQVLAENDTVIMLTKGSKNKIRF